MPTLETAIRLRRPRDEVFPFFADAFNLERITPPWLRFRLLTPPPIEMRPGLLIDYALHLRGVPVRWQSEITSWEPPLLFVDEQRRGPYRRWIHRHTFEEDSEGTLVEDRVDYAVLGGWLVDRTLVRHDLERIFRFRHEAIAALLGQ